MIISAVIRAKNPAVALFALVCTIAKKSHGDYSASMVKPLMTRQFDRARLLTVAFGNAGQVAKDNR
jgi:hypothetical protein